MHRILCVVLAGTAGLAACGPSDRTVDTPAAPQVSCDASFFETLRGEPIDVVQGLTTPLRVRVLGPDDFVPRDFDPDRLTFTESPEGTVSRVFCG